MALEILSQRPSTNSEIMIQLSGGGGLETAAPTPETPPVTTLEAGGGPPATPTATGGSMPATAPGPTYGAPTTSAINIPDYTPSVSGIYGDLFKSITGDVGEAYKGLGGLAQQFTGQAGPFRDFESEKPKLESSYATRTVTPEARELVDPTYGGPRGLGDVDQAGVDRTAASVGRLEAQRRALGTGAGVRDLIEQYAPGITPGEARWEARRLGGDPGFQEAKRAMEEDLSRLYGTFYGAGATAEAIGKARQAQEEELAQKSRGFIQEREKETMDPLLGRMAEASARDQAAADAYRKFKESGDWRDLVGQEIREGENVYQAEDLYSPRARLSDEAAARKAEIETQFPDLAGIPLMQPGESHGRETLRFDPAWWAEHEKDHTATEWAEIKRQARLRNKAYAEAGFSPRAENYQTPEVQYQTEGPGKFASVAPMYYALQNFAEPDLKTYLKISEAEVPTIENMATGDEKAILNWVNELLGVMDRYDPEAKPFESVIISGEVDRYLKDAEKLSQDMLKAGAEGAEQFATDLRRARRQYKKAVSKKKRGRIGGAIGGYAGFLLGGLGAPIGYQIGKSIGESTA